jgi:hypothetical protein
MPFVEDAVFSPPYIFSTFVKKLSGYSFVDLFLGPLILFHWSIYLVLFQYHANFLLLCLCVYNLKLGIVIPLGLFFLLRIAFVIQILMFFMSFMIVFLYFNEEYHGILMVIKLNL